LLEIWLKQSSLKNIVLHIVHFKRQQEIDAAMRGYAVSYELTEAQELFFSNQALNKAINSIKEPNPLIVVADLTVPLSPNLLESASLFTIPGKKVWTPQNVDEIRMVSFYRR
jgi:hypothetical protein